MTSKEMIADSFGSYIHRLCKLAFHSLSRRGERTTLLMIQGM